MLNTWINYIYLNNSIIKNSNEQKVVDIFKELKEYWTTEKDELINERFKNGDISDIYIKEVSNDDFFNKIMISFMTPQYDDIELIDYITSVYKVKIIYDFLDELNDNCFRYYVNEKKENLIFELDYDLEDSKKDKNDDISDKVFSLLIEKIENKLMEEYSLKKLISFLSENTLESQEENKVIDILNNISVKDQFYFWEKNLIKLCEKNDECIIKYNSEYREILNLIYKVMGKNKTLKNLFYWIVKTDSDDKLSIPNWYYLNINMYEFLIKKGKNNFIFTDKF